MKKYIKALSFATSAAMAMSLMMPAALAATLDNNPKSGTVALVNAADEMPVNYGTITTNEGRVYSNHGTIVNNNYEITANYGTVTTNTGVIDFNYGTVTNNVGTVNNNYNSTVGGSGTVINDYPHAIDIDFVAETNSLEFSAVSGDADDFSDSNGSPIYAKDGVSISFKAKAGYSIIGKVSIKKGNLVENSDGSYTIKNISEDDALTVKAIKESEMVAPVAKAYKKLAAALNGNDFEELKTAVEGFNNVLDIYNALSSAQRDELGREFNMTGEEFFGEVLDNWSTASITFEMYHKQEDYIEEPSKETANALIEYYDGVAKDPEWKDLMDLIRKFLPKLDEAYQQARFTLGESAGDEVSKTEEGKSPKTADFGVVKVIKNAVNF